MKRVLYQNPNIELRLSPIHGYGVFAKHDILSGSILEESSFINLTDGIKNDYVFWYPRGGTPNSDHIAQSQVLVFGYASLYNHADNANATWITDIDNEMFVFMAQTDIKKNDEILIYYGDNDYWELFPQINKI